MSSVFRRVLKKQAVQVRALGRSLTGRTGQAKVDGRWWDEFFYRSGVSDRATIHSGFGEVAARYHYASVELRILRSLLDRRVNVEGASVLDIGSGSGHWVAFYLSLGARRVFGVDLSRNAVDHLQTKYAADPSVTFRQGRAVDVLRTESDRFDVVNAIGVMFHLVDDQEWEDTVACLGERCRPGGLLVVGGHFGPVDGLDVQIDREGRINKRLRSLRHWRASLAKAGFDDVVVFRNHAWLFVDDPLPENNVLVARRRS